MAGEPFEFVDTRGRRGLIGNNRFDNFSCYFCSQSNNFELFFEVFKTHLSLSFIIFLILQFIQTQQFITESEN